MACRPGCGACCIALSISSAIPGMPQGKPAGVRCVQLAADNRCRLFGRSDRPAVCVGLRPSVEMCGGSFEEAMAYLSALERSTAPEAQRPRRIPRAAACGAVNCRPRAGMSILEPYDNL